MVHEIKLREEFADAVLSGRKSFEIRFNDRGYQKGDHIKFKVIDVLGCAMFHPLCEEEFVITYVLGGWGLKEEYVALAIKRVTDERKA